MFGVNDSTENLVTGSRNELGGVQPFELAYYVYRDPRYASIIKLDGGARDLLYGVPELPENTPETYRDSAHADNVGLAMLRSRTPDRPISQQIQAVLHYGTHGWAHGHYDRTDLLSLMRYGRSFWNPESVFWVYEPFLYKFYTQTSLNHNMVVVDEKMQEATPGERLLFHTGPLMQATAVETTARWSNPPYGGMVYDLLPVKTFAEKAWREGKSVPLPKDPPKYGTLTDYTESVLQRRLMVVTDDYVVVADYLKGAKPHLFESLFQPKGFLGLDAPAKKFCATMRSGIPIPSVARNSSPTAIGGPSQRPPSPASATSSAPARTRPATARSATYPAFSRLTSTPLATKAGNPDRRRARDARREQAPLLHRARRRQNAHRGQIRRVDSRQRGHRRAR